jgi:inosose dehydratase
MTLKRMTGQRTTVPRMPVQRRTLLMGAISGLTVAGLPLGPAALAQSGNRRHRIGHTGITWGYAPENAAQAIADVGRLGFGGFESFGSVIEYWEAQGGIGELLDAAGLPLIGAYCPMVLTDPGARATEVAKIVRWGRLIRKYGGTVAVIGPDNVDRQGFDFAASRATIVGTLNDIGMALADIGLVGALHQHTGSCIQSRDETDFVMHAVDTDVVKLCPDTGEMLSAGIDPVAAIRDYLAIVAHVHIKDFDAGTRHDGYCPVGTGRVDVAGVIDVLESTNADFMIMAELNPDSSVPATAAGELAATSKRAFETLGFDFRPA